jgi:uncharacterized protein
MHTSKFQRASFLFLGLLLAGCTTDSSSSLPQVELRGPEGEVVQLRVEVADDIAKRTRGLMFREGLGENQGMLFVFSGEQRLSFWMKNTLIPLDILFFDGEGQFVSWTAMDPCEGDPCPHYFSESLARFALEVNAGFVEEHGLKTGWELHVPF